MATAVSTGDVDLKTVKRRIEWIDVAKGIAMILVFYGHLPGSGDNPWFPDLVTSRSIVYYFHMPLFFVLSGLTLRLNVPFRKFEYKRFRRLIIPYYFFSLYAIAKILLKIVSPSTFSSFHSKGMSSIRTELLNILLGNTEGLWFFWALFWGDLILWALYRFNKSRLLIPGIIIAMILWQFIPLLPFTLPFQLATSAEAVGFTGFGLIISKWMLRMGGRRACVSLVIAVLSFCILAWMAFVSPSNIFIRLILAILVAMAGSCMIMFLSILLPAFRWFTPIGRNTIVFYGLNGLSLAIARTLFFHIVPVNVVVPNVLSQLLSGFAIIAVACLFCGVAVVIINRFLPWSIGLPRKD